VDKWIKDNERFAPDVLIEVAALCRELATKAGLRNITIVTDCPDFDLGRTDALADRCGAWDRPFRFLGTGVRHVVNDPGERLAQLGDEHEQRFKEWVQAEHPEARHTHYPDDDAYHCYAMQLYCDAHIGSSS